jgi:hypothetical protein
MHEKPRLCFGFPPWLVQVGANLVARHPNRIAPIPATNEASSAGCIDTHSVSFSGHQSWRPSNLRRRKPRLQTIILLCRAKFAPTWASQGGKQEYVRRGTIVWFPNLLPPGQAKVESKNTYVGVVRLSGFQICSHLDEPRWKAFVVQPVRQSRRFPNSPVRNRFSKPQTRNFKTCASG